MSRKRKIFILYFRSAYGFICCKKTIKYQPHGPYQISNVPKEERPKGFINLINHEGLKNNSANPNLGLLCP